MSGRVVGRVEEGWLCTLIMSLWSLNVMVILAAAGGDKYNVLHGGAGESMGRLKLI